MSKHDRYSRIARIAELQGRYRPEHDTPKGKWRVWDSEKSERLPAEYSDEATARAGARLQAACDIDALYDGGKS